MVAILISMNYYGIMNVLFTFTENQTFYKNLEMQILEWIWYSYGYSANVVCVESRGQGAKAPPLSKKSILAPQTSPIS